MKTVLIKAGAIATLAGIMALPAQANATDDLVEAIAVAAVMGAVIDDGYQKVHYAGHGYRNYRPDHRYWDRRAHGHHKKWHRHHRHAHRHGYHGRHFDGHRGHGYDRHGYRDSRNHRWNDRGHDRGHDRRDRYDRDRRHH